jgi:hypothetical protein
MGPQDTGVVTGDIVVLLPTDESLLQEGEGTEKGKEAEKSYPPIARFIKNMIELNGLPR